MMWRATVRIQSAGHASRAGNNNLIGLESSIRTSHPCSKHLKLTKKSTWRGNVGRRRYPVSFKQESIQTLHQRANSWHMAIFTLPNLEHSIPNCESRKFTSSSSSQPPHAEPSKASTITKEVKVDVTPDNADSTPQLPKNSSSVPDPTIPLEDSEDESNPSRRRVVYGAKTNPPLLSSEQSIGQTEEDWEEADLKLRRMQAIKERKQNQIRSDNVMRAIRGNIVICIAKFAAWSASGSSAVLSEFVHSVVDTLNQGLILVGLRDSNTAADRKHPYGYGKSLYFWSLISAMGTFWMGAGVAGRHSLEQLMHPSLNAITWEVWSVLAFSFVVDGYVLAKTLGDIRSTQPSDQTIWQHIWSIRDPALMAILLEDGAACLGVVMAGGGIMLTAATDMPVFDGLAGVGVSALLAGMGLILIRLNKEFLLGQAQDRKTVEGIQRILLEQESIEHVHSMQTQVLGHGKFSFKAEVDFDGTYLAAKLMPRYQKEFDLVGRNLDQELRVLLSWFAEDVMRTVEREVRRIEYEIRKVYPGAVFIELEPYSKDFYRYAVDDAMEGKLKRIEIEALNKYLKSLYMDSYEKLAKQAKVPSPDELKAAAEKKQSQNETTKVP